MIIQEEHDIEQLQERERAVRQLESDILDVNTIFKVNFWFGSGWVGFENPKFWYKTRIFPVFVNSSYKNGNGLSDN